MKSRRQKARLQALILAATCLQRFSLKAIAGILNALKRFEMPLEINEKIRARLLVCNAADTGCLTITLEPWTNALTSAQRQ